MPAKVSGIIFRDNLMRSFSDLSDERFIYVCAPAGYGKTVAVQQWLDNNACKGAVVSLDDYDNNPALFCERFCAALNASQPQNSAFSELVSHPAFGSAPDEFTIRAIGALSGKKRAIFVVDDLHFIHNEIVLRLLLNFLKRLPENIQVIITSRTDLPPGFSDLWIEGRLVCITAEQIRFSKEEISLLYKKRGISITQEQTEDIYSFTNGWAIGLNALLLSGGVPSKESLDYLEGFIRSNVWEKWDEVTREFMLSTAAARELNPSLCSILSGISDSDKLLKKLMYKGAFIFQSSDDVYHYHHLFHNFLKQMQEARGDEYLFPLLEKEGQWHLARRDYYGAAECFIRCKGYDMIARCFEKPKSADRSNFVIERALPIVQTPEMLAAAKRHPYLFSTMAWAAFAGGRIEEMVEYMDQYYARYPEIASKTPAQAHFVIFVRLMDFRVSMSDLARELTSLAIMPGAKTGTGTITMNMPLLHRSTRDFSELATGDPETCVERFVDMVGWMLGEEAKLLAESMTAGLLYEQGHLEKAYVHALAANDEIKKHFAPESKFCAIAVLIYILDALGEKGEAQQALGRIASMIEQHRAYYLYYNYNALAARRKLSDGDIKTARDWLAAHETILYDGLTVYRIYGTLTVCRAYIACGDYDSAIILLTRVLAFTRIHNRPLGIIEQSILLSIAYWKKKRGFQKEAMVYLENAVSVAYNFGYTQLFINEGAELNGMLRRLQKSVEQRGDDNTVPASFIKMIYLKSLEKQGGGLTSGQSERPMKYTDKQKTVMRLICAGKSYREITEIMGIKLPTLRSHIALIYKKLDVTSEADAVMKIRTAGLLEEE